MNFTQIVTDRIVPVLTGLTLAGTLYLSVVLALNGSIGGTISTGLVSVLLGVVVAHDVKRLFLTK
jgi:CHASE2 domain-containing sensor protein